MKINNVIKKPITTEKSMNLSSKGSYIFEVGLNASKGAIANEIEGLYNVNVTKVRTMIMPGNPRKLYKNSRETGRVLWKKAIVELKEGQTINFIEGK